MGTFWKLFSLGIVSGFGGAWLMARFLATNPTPRQHRRVLAWCWVVFFASVAALVIQNP